MTTRATHEDAGCWVDGHWGQYGVARMVELAEDYGYDDAEVIDIAARHLSECSHPGTDANLTDDEHEILFDAVDRVETWLNDQVAPEGYSFGWSDGEFMLWSDASWQDADVY